MVSHMSTNTANDTIRTMLRHIGAGNIMAISGNRVTVTDTATVHLPVARGYTVEVEYLVGHDLYAVRRLFKRGGVFTVKGEAFGLYADQVGEAAYRASCFEDGPFGEVPSR